MVCFLGQLRNLYNPNLHNQHKGQSKCEATDCATSANKCGRWSLFKYYCTSSPMFQKGTLSLKLPGNIPTALMMLDQSQEAGREEQPQLASAQVSDGLYIGWPMPPLWGSRIRTDHHKNSGRVHPAPLCSVLSRSDTLRKRNPLLSVAWSFSHIHIQPDAHSTTHQASSPRGHCNDSEWC